MLWGGLCADGEEAACRDIHHGEPAVDDWDCRQPPVPGGLPCKGRGLGGYAGGPVAVQGGQVLVYPNKMKFGAPAEQEGYVRRWLEERIGMLPRLDLNFYPGKCRGPRKPRSRFRTPVLLRSSSQRSSGLTRIKTKVKVSPLRKPRKVSSSTRTRGFRSWPRSSGFWCFCDFSKEKRSILPVGDITQTISVDKADIAVLEEPEHLTWYHHGQRWKKQILKSYRCCSYQPFGIREEGEKRAIRLSAATQDVLSYKVFVNPSTTDVVCTTTSEALAMGKILICGNHPSNEFFKRFPNLPYVQYRERFVRLAMKAVAEVPIPLSVELSHELSWEAATERFVRVADIAPTVPVKQHPFSSQHFMHIAPDELKKNMEEASAFFHNAISGIGAARCVFGAVPNTAAR